eukprot:PITA_26211
MESSRVKAIENWVEPKNVHEMRVFLGITNYQWKFVQGYSKVTSAPTDLLKKDKKWCWTEKCQKAFDDLKRRMVTTPILKFPDFGRPFEVHTNASDFSIGGVLMQDGHPVAYESRKLQDRERRYPVHEKEMTAIIHCLHDFLAEFDMSIEYRPGRHNALADALSRKGQLAALEGEDQATRSRSRIQMSEEMQNKLKESVETDTLAHNIVKQIREGKTCRFFL